MTLILRRRSLSFLCINPCADQRNGIDDRARCERGDLHGRPGLQAARFGDSDDYRFILTERSVSLRSLSGFRKQRSSELPKIVLTDGFRSIRTVRTGLHSRRRPLAATIDTM